MATRPEGRRAKLGVRVRADRPAAESKYWRIELNRSIIGGPLPPNYQYFWNRPFGRGTCAFLSAVALAGVGLPVLEESAISQQDYSAAKTTENATWGLRKGGRGS